jgi:hypothetical protein
MDARDCLSILSPFCRRQAGAAFFARGRGSYWLARLAAKFGPEIALDDLTD